MDTWLFECVNMCVCVRVCVCVCVCRLQQLVLTRIPYCQHPIHRRFRDTCAGVR